jgi:hypothetical protein
VTGGYDGLIVVWNTDSGAVSAHLAPPGLSHASLQERSIEQVPLPCFLPCVCFNGGKSLHCIHVLQATRVEDGTVTAAGMMCT